jgi:hypothetical protein
MWVAHVIRRSDKLQRWRTCLCGMAANSKKLRSGAVIEKSPEKAAFGCLHVLTAS